MSDLPQLLQQLRVRVEQLDKPEYAELLAVLREKCSACNSVGSHKAYLSGGDYRSECKVCKGTGYSTRNIEGWPKGALCGALIWAARDLPATLTSWTVLECLMEDDPDLASVKALSEALK